MTAVQPEMSLKQYYAGLRLADKFVIEERRRSTIDERIDQADIWFGITNRMEAARRAKEENELRQAWARVFKAWRARYKAPAKPQSNTIRRTGLAAG